MFEKICSIILTVVFLTGSVLPARAQSVLLPEPAKMITLSDAFKPCLLRGIKLDSADPFRFNFVVDAGSSGLEGEAFEDETERLVKYFLAALTTPEKDLWVNLSPYENNRIVEENFGRTEMGRDLLALDYVLKQLTSSLMYPDSALGKKFWDEIYRRTYEQFGTTDIPLDTFNKVWIVPEHALVYENSGEADKTMSAYIDNAKLKVMLEADYLATEKNLTPTRGHGAPQQDQEWGSVSPSTLPSDFALNAKAPQGNPTAPNEIAQNVIRSVILPVLEQEINEGKHFAELRQIYHSLLLSVWFKKKWQNARMRELPDGRMKGNPLAMVFMDQQKTDGVETLDPKGEISGIYSRYVEAFEKGVYNLIREDRDIYTDEPIPRKYFSGGANLADAAATTDFEQAPSDYAADSTGARNVTIDLTPSGKIQKPAEVSFSMQVDQKGNARSNDKIYDSQALSTVIYDALVDRKRLLSAELKERTALFFLFTGTSAKTPVGQMSPWDFLLKEFIQNALGSVEQQKKVSFQEGKSYEGAVVFDARVVDGEFILSIRDNGIGLQEGYTQGSTKGRPDRRGKGFALSKAWVESLGGTCKITDNLEQGEAESGAIVKARIPLNNISSMEMIEKKTREWVQKRAKALAGDPSEMVEEGATDQAAAIGKNKMSRYFSRNFLAKAFSAAIMIVSTVLPSDLMAAVKSNTATKSAPVVITVSKSAVSADAPVVIDQLFLEEVAQMINAYEKDPGGTKGEQLKRTLESKNVNLKDLETNINDWYRREPASRIFGSARGFAKAMFCVAYNESTVGKAPGSVWHTLDATFAELKQLYPEYLQGADKNDPRVAIANMAHLSRIMHYFYPTASDQDKRIMVFGTYNFGPRAVYWKASKDNLALLVLQAARQNDPRMFDKIEMTPELRDGLARMTRYSRKAESLFSGGLPVTSVSIKELVSATGFFEVPDGFLVVPAGSRHAEEYGKSRNTLVKDMGIFPTQIAFLDFGANKDSTPMGTRILHRADKTWVNGFEFSTDMKTLQARKNFLSALVRKYYSEILKNDPQQFENLKRWVLFFNDLPNEQSMMGRSLIYMPIPSEMAQPHLLPDLKNLKRAAALPSNGPSSAFMAKKMSEQVAKAITGPAGYAWRLSPDLKTRIATGDQVANFLAQQLIVGNPSGKPYFVNNADVLGLVRKGELVNPYLPALNALGPLTFKMNSEDPNKTWPVTYLKVVKVLEDWNIAAKKAGIKPAEISITELIRTEEQRNRIPTPAKGSKNKKATGISSHMKQMYETAFDFTVSGKNNAEKARVKADMLKILKNDLKLRVLDEGDRLHVVVPRDHAEAVDSAEEVDNAADLGGIDLNTDRLDMLIRGNAGNMEFEMTPEDLETLTRDVRGFVPVIINVEPINNIPAFLSLIPLSSR